jgi:hypothetical protein
MVKLFKKKTNFDRFIRDSKNNVFRIDEHHSGFVWLRNSKGDLKQIGKGKLRFFKNVKK